MNVEKGLSIVFSLGIMLALAPLFKGHPFLSLGWVVLMVVYVIYCIRR